MAHRLSWIPEASARGARIVLVALLAVVLPAVSHAACREGDDALADDRALAAVRATIEEECPCDAYDGTPGRGRDDYRRCAEDQIDLAAQRGDLDAACTDAAEQVVAGSTCGTSAVPCASVTGSRDVRVGCRLTTAAACRATSGGRRARLPIKLLPDRPSALRTPVSPFPGARGGGRACTEQTTCADVVEWTAGTCVDTREDGPYAPGFTELRIVKPSAVDPSQDRVLDVVVWYPAVPGAGPIDSESRAVRDAPLDPSGGPYPLVVFSHGSCGFPRQSLFLTPWLATHGFVVVAPPHPGNTLFEFPGCGDPGSLAAAFVERPEDVSFTLDRMLAADQDPASPFFGAIDERRLGMSGHSFGGLTTYLVLERDDRFVAAMPLAAATTQTSSLDVPSLTMLGEIDSVVDNDGIRAAYARSDEPKLLVGVENAGHYAFSDGCFPSADCSPPATLTQDEAHERVKRWVLPFLKVYLAGDRGFVPFLTSDPPFGILVERE